MINCVLLLCVLSCILSGPVYLPFSLAIAVLVIGVSVFMCWKHKQKRRQGMTREGPSVFEIMACHIWPLALQCVR